MKIAVIGTGYVGLVTGLCFATKHQVVCIDKDPSKINMLINGRIPIYEEGICELFEKVKSRIEFTTDVTTIKQCEVIFICVGTPEGEDGKPMLNQVYSAIGDIAVQAESNKTIVMKSTVLVGTCADCNDIVNPASDFGLMAKYKGIHHVVVSNPEFLKEGTAIFDFFNPDRVVIGCDGEFFASKVIDDLYRSVLEDTIYVHTSTRSAELIKYTSNCFLATKVAFVNELSELCELLGADIEQVRAGVITDKRIGTQFFKPGPGYGGSCFPKDVKGYINMGQIVHKELRIASAVDESNKIVKRFRLLDKLVKAVGSVEGKKIAVLGAAFKASTDDIRESSGLDLISNIVKLGGKVFVHDTFATENVVKWLLDNGLDDSVVVYHCLDFMLKEPNLDAIVLVTDHEEYKKIDWKKVVNNCKVLVDGRNLYSLEEMAKIGMTYLSIGRKDVFRKETDVR
jgi:UDPglucose 6-dehydrogenase